MCLAIIYQSPFKIQQRQNQFNYYWLTVVVSFITNFLKKKQGHLFIDILYFHKEVSTISYFNVGFWYLLFNGLASD